MTDAHDRPRDIPALTGLRAIAAWWVVLYHIRAAFEGQLPASAIAVLAKGYLAVDMFFVLSGFVIYLNYATRVRADAGSIADFMVRRIARIYPLHFVLLMAMGAFALAVAWKTGAPPTESPPDLFVPNLLLVQTWGFVDQLSWNVPAWSISTELFAYLLFPLIPLVVRWERWPIWALAGALGGIAVGLHLAFAAAGHAALGDDIPHMGLLRCVTQFAIGTGLCALFLRLRAAPPGLAAGLIGAAVVLTVGVTAAGWTETLAIPLLWMALVLGIALWPANWPHPLATRPLVYLGDISYSTYLVHYFAFILFKLLFVDSDGQVPLGLTLGFIAGVFVASVALYHGCERPAQRWLLARWKAR